MKPVMKTKNMREATWAPCHFVLHGRLSKAERDSLPATAFAFAIARKEPMIDAAHVRNAMARFDQVKDVTDSERELAFSNIQKAAKHFEIEMVETDWHQFGTR